MPILVRREVTPWIWGGILASVLILALLIYGLSDSQSKLEQAKNAEQNQRIAQNQQPEQVRPTPQAQPSTPSGTGAGPTATRPQPRTVTPPRPARTTPVPVITDRGQVEDRVTKEPLDVYMEATRGQNNGAPGDIVLAPRRSQPSGDMYRKTNLPASFEVNNETYVIEPGAPMQMSSEDLVPIGLQTGNYTVYQQEGDNADQPTLYLKVKSNPDYYVAYSPPMTGSQG